jgi:transcription antitermination factor NusG
VAKITLNDGSILEGTTEELAELLEKVGGLGADNGDNFRKVEGREPRVGDYVKFFEDDLDITAGKYYEIIDVDDAGDFVFLDDDGDNQYALLDYLGEDFEVFEEISDEGPLKVGDYVVPLESADDDYDITNTEMKLGKVVEGDVDCYDDIRIEVVAHENDIEVGKSYSVKSEHFRKATNEEVAQAKEELEFANFAEGDKVRLISGGGEYPLSGYENGKIYTVKSPKCRHDKTFGYMVQLTGGSSAHGYAKPKQLEKVPAEELAQAKAEQKWAKIGRKPGEFKKGDIVRVVECTGAHEIGEIVELAEDGAAEYLGKDGFAFVGEPEWFELVAPVESRVDIDD